MALAKTVEEFIRAEAARDTAARDVVKGMKHLGVTTAMIPSLRAIIHVEDVEDPDSSVWAETDVPIGT